MTTITIDKQSLIRACALAGIEHTIALRIMAYLPPMPGAEQYRPEYKTLIDHNGRITGVQWTNFDDRPPVGSSKATPPISDDMRGEPAAGMKPVDLTTGWPRPLETPAPRPNAGEPGVPTISTGSQVHPNMALPHKRMSTFTPGIKPFIPRWQIDLQYRSEQPDWPKPWRLKVMTIKNSRAAYRRTDFYDTFEEAFATIPRNGL
jgi:hypothetical protein